MEHAMRVRTVVFPALIEKPGGTVGRFRRWQPDQGEEIPALEMRALILELLPAFQIDHLTGGIGKIAQDTLSPGRAVLRHGPA
jgi:hypothetical protein